MVDHSHSWEWVAERLPLLNVSEVARRADVPYNRIYDARRGRQPISPGDLAKVVAVIQTLADESP